CLRIHCNRFALTPGAAMHFFTQEKVFNFESQPPVPLGNLACLHFTYDEGIFTFIESISLL
ncbi:hypothetical protein, partial [Onishia niordana]|uniref:hypothetical protein n=1 Tax=Onishia niordana TaxID=2508711 RepID=UPI00197ABA76